MDTSLGALSAGLTGAVAGVSVKRDTDTGRNQAVASGDDSVKASLSHPVVDTAEITGGTIPKTGDKTSIFDPAAAAGSHAQQHIDGSLATSSAKDGYDGWATMMKKCFGAVNGVPCGYKNQGAGNDMPVISHWDFSPGQTDGYGLSDGYIPANALTHKERNLIANLYVYAHDNGISEHAVDAITSQMVNYAQYGHQYTYWNNTYTTHLSEWVTGAHAGKESAVFNRESMINSFRKGKFNVMQTETRDDSESFAMDAVAMRVLSSAALDDNLINKEVISQVFAAQWTSPLGNTLGSYEDIEKLIYAYSARYPDGGEVKSVSAEANKYMSWRVGEIAARHDIEAAAKQPPRDTPETQGDTPAGASPEKITPSPTEVFTKYAKRISGLVGTLNDSQKSTLGMMYRLAEQRGDEKSLQKVDALAKALATSNFMEVMFLPGKDKNGNTTTNLLDMLILTKDLPDQTKLIQAILAKPNQETTPKTLTKTPLEASTTKPTQAHLDTQA